MSIRSSFLFLFFFSVCFTYGQSDPSVPGFDTSGRQWLIGGLTTAGYGGSLLVLQATWYDEEGRSRLHSFDDSREWLQVDKAGHGWTAYNASLATSRLWQWAGLTRREGAIAGSLSALVFLTGIEVLDGYSEKWGWSWSDLGANFLGTGLFLGQELVWQEQRISYKFSFHRNGYPDPVLHKRVNELYGSSFGERMLKDYNAQTYWLSFNLSSFAKKTNLPPWLNLALGYGATGLYGGFENRWIDPGTMLSIDRSEIRRTRQFYLAPDIDFTRIPTRSKFLRTGFTVLNAFKCPMPALMLNSRGQWKVHALFF